MRHLIHATLALALLNIAPMACASAPRADSIDRPVESQSERLMRLRGSLRTLRDSDNAKFYAADLDRTEVWLLEAERAPTQGDTDEERVAILMDAVEGQIARVQAAYARRDAEQRLEARRERYVERQQNVARLETETASK